MTITTVSPIPPGFWSEGACHDLPAEWFHPEQGGSTREAKAVCTTCRIRLSCLEWALTNKEKFGIWGGTSERERRRIRRRLAAGEHIPQLAPDQIPHDLTPSPPPPPLKEPAVDLAPASPEPTAPPTNGALPDDPDTGRPTDACVNCGKRYTPARKDQRFHSKECARAWYSSHPKDETGNRHPRIRQPGAANPPAPPAAVTLPTPTTPEPVELPTLLGQLLAGCDHWTVEADLGDVHVTVSRGRE
jgi:WhiB family transcriptional regulator, redox-sensing transcriptional regulator